MTEQINALPETITLNDKTAVEAARTAYDALTDDQKAFVEEDTVTALTAAETAIADLEAAKAVTEQINALPEEITLDAKETVEAARAAYDALTDDQKALVEDETLAILTDAEDKIAAATVTDMIDKLPAEVTAENVNDVVSASTAYEALTDDQKALVDEQSVKKLVTAANAAVKILVDMKEAEKVENTINALPENVTDADKAAVEAARAAYDALTDDQKALVDADVLKKLTDAEEALSEDIILGDVDGDGEITITDALLIQRYDLEMVTLNAAQLKAADVDGDGDVTILDVSWIQRYIAEIPVQYPIGESI